jgi:hypothetical protein
LNGLSMWASSPDGYTPPVAARTGADGKAQGAQRAGSGPPCV